VKVYESKDIRNVGVVGHGGSGKTSLTAGMLFAAGATNRLCASTSNTITDFDEEVQRRITVATAPAFVEWKVEINIYTRAQYSSTTPRQLVAADGAGLVDARPGWKRRRKRFGISRTIIIFHGQS
jgi:elongation factor G